MKCNDTLEVQGLGIVYCQENGNHEWHQHKSDGLVNVEWKRNPLEVKGEGLSKLQR